MTHKITKLAETVLQDSENYTECVLYRAQYILDWSNSRRAAIAKLWLVYRRVYQKYVYIMHGVATQRAHRQMRELLFTEFGNNVDLKNDFHKCKNAMNNYYGMLLTFMFFEASVKASHCKSISLMYKYMTCANAERHDESLGAVGFLRHVPKEELSEILLFRLLRKS